jgi:CheY-like chemotaxis protein
MKKLLVVEDNPEYAELAEHCLSAEYEVTVVRDAGVASAVVTTTPVDAILLDVMLPGFSGPDFVDWMQTDETLRDIPVILVTAAHLQGALKSRCVRHSNVRALVDKISGLPAVMRTLQQSLLTA